LKGNDLEFEQWLDDEVRLIGKKDINGDYPILKYYMELCEFNNLPCMAYVNQKLQYWSQQYGDPNVIIDLVADLTPDNISYHVPRSDIPRIWNADFLYNEYVQKVGFTCLYSQSYPLNACYNTPQNQQLFSKIPETLPSTSGDRVLAKVVSVSEYEDWLQDNLDHVPSVWEGGPKVTCSVGSTNFEQWPGDFRSALQMCNALSKLSGKPFIFMPQAHELYTQWEIHREPTNEELDMMANVIVSYGAKSLHYYAFPSFEQTLPPGDFGTGIANPDYNLREVNYYGQSSANGSRDKWEVFQSIADRMTNPNKWGPYLMSFDNTKTNSYIYRLENERIALLSSSYFADVISYEYGTGFPDCVAQDPGGDAPTYTRYECREFRYLQVATFQKTNEDGNQYFMIVNRRCSPLQTNHNDGQRFIRVKFDKNSPFFPVYNTWKIIDLETGNTVAVFDKTLENHLVDLGMFDPGHGKLYKIAPEP